MASTGAEKLGPGVAQLAQKRGINEQRAMGGEQLELAKHVFLPETKALLHKLRQ